MKTAAATGVRWWADVVATDFIMDRAANITRNASTIRIAAAKVLASIIKAPPRPLSIATVTSDGTGLAVPNVSIHLSNPFVLPIYINFLITLFLCL